ncbi:MAG: XRE family transcriptional regulator [Actinomycetota bacterium]
MGDDEYRTPGQLIEHLLEERGWTQRILAIVLRIDESGLNKLVAAKRPLDANLAIALGEVFGVDPDRLLELQKSYDLAKARLVTRPDPGRAMRAWLFGNLPVAEMMARGWIETADLREVSKVETGLCRFFSVPSVDQIEFLPHAPKKTDVFAPPTAAQLAWLYRVREIAAEMLVPRYSPRGLRDAVEAMRPLRIAVEATRKVPRILSDAGVRFVIVETLKSAKIDGVCFWLNDLSPVIAMSLRYDRIDNFWFVLRHEIEHVMRRHGKGAVMLDAELEGERAGSGPTVVEEERVANEAAADFCVSQASLDRFIARKAPYFPERDMLGFAHTLQIHPGLVAGQLQRRTGRYDRFRTHQVKVRYSIAPCAVVDGWGDVAPVGD